MKIITIRVYRKADQPKTLTIGIAFEIGNWPRKYQNPQTQCLHCHRRRQKKKGETQTSITIFRRTVSLDKHANQLLFSRKMNTRWGHCPPSNNWRRHKKMTCNVKPTKNVLRKDVALSVNEDWLLWRKAFTNGAIQIVVHERYLKILFWRGHCPTLARYFETSMMYFGYKRTCYLSYMSLGVHEFVFESKS